MINLNGFHCLSWQECQVCDAVIHSLHRFDRWPGNLHKHETMSTAETAHAEYCDEISDPFRPFAFNLSWIRRLKLKRSTLQSSLQTKITNKGKLNQEIITQQAGSRKFVKWKTNENSIRREELRLYNNSEKWIIHLKMNKSVHVFTHIQHLTLNVVDNSCGFHNLFAKQTTCDWSTRCETPPLDGVVRSGSISWDV